MDVTQERNITFLISSLAGGGAEGVCVNIANGLARRGWNITLIILHLNNSVHHKNLHPKVQLVVLGISNARHSIIPLYKYLKTNKPKKLVVFNYELTIFSLFIKKLTRLNFYLITRNINSLTEKTKYFERNWRTRLMFWLIQKVYIKADHIMNQCQGMQEDLLSIFPSIKHKTSVIYNPVNSKLEELGCIPANIVNKNTFEEPYFLCIGRLEKQKSFHFAIQAFSLVSKMDSKLRLKIVGKGSLEGALKKKALELDVAHRVDFEGFNSETLTYFLNAKATVLTSLYEGFPNVLVESITLGTPVIAFDCKSGPKEIVVKGKNGILVEYQNVDALAEAMISVTNNNILYQDVRKTSLRYSLSEIIDKWELLLADV